MKKAMRLNEPSKWPSSFFRSSVVNRYLGLRPWARFPLGTQDFFVLSRDKMNILSSNHNTLKFLLSGTLDGGLRGGGGEGVAMFEAVR